MEIRLPLSEYGEFWIAEDDKSFSPTSKINGKIEINEDGEIVLEIDRHNYGWKYAVKHDSELSFFKPKVYGYLNRIHIYIYLEDTFVSQPAIQNTGAFIPGAIGAFNCVFAEDFDSLSQLSTVISGLVIGLGKNWPWMGFNLPRVSHEHNVTTIQYPSKIEKVYRISDGSITIRSGQLINSNLHSRDLSVEHVASIHIKFDVPIPFSHVRNYFNDVEDFILLLTNQPQHLEQQELELENHQKRYKFICRLNDLSPCDVSYFGCWMPFSDIDSYFGQIFDKWRSLRKQYGSAIYSLSSVQRNKSQVVEHRFVTILSGLEALHTRSGKKPHIKSLAGENGAEGQADQISRILDTTKNVLQDSDHEWLEKKLKAKQQSLSLAARLKHLFVELPINFDLEGMDRFIRNCVGFRVDISHFGGPRPQSDYSNFVVEVEKSSSALEQLYHLVVLKTIGVPDQAINAIVFLSHAGYHIRFDLTQVGIIAQPNE